MKLPLIFSLILITLLSGCNTTNTRPEEVNLYSIPDKPSQPIKLPEQQSYEIGTELMSLINNYEQSANKAMPADMKFKAQSKITQVAGSSQKVVTSSFKMLTTDESQQHFFDPGSYTIDKKSGLAYVMFTTGLIEQIYKRYNSQYELIILVDFFGAADGAPFRSKVPYKGELGNSVNIAKEDLLINGIQPRREFNLQTGESLTNEYLAVLRAYSMSYYFKNWPNRDKQALDKIQQSRFIANTYNHQGGNWRFAKIVIKVKQRPLTLNTVKL